MFRSFLFGIPIGITVLDCVGYVAKVEGISMQPVLNPEENTFSDFIFLSRWYSRFCDFKRGDVVCVISPKNKSQKIVKRIIALEGDLIETLGYKEKFVRVPQGHCWVEGDNVGHSFDSNLFGAISLGLVTAKASHIVWPPNRWSKIESKIPLDRNSKT